MKGGGKPKGMSLHSGMKNTMTKAPGVMIPRKQSVDSGTTRSKTAPSPKTLGGREA